MEGRLKMTDKTRRSGAPESGLPRSRALQDFSGGRGSQKNCLTYFKHFKAIFAESSTEFRFEE
jgi:hypothetical protein